VSAAWQFTHSKRCTRGTLPETSGSSYTRIIARQRCGAESVA